ncbi:MAG TPA: hypothetical protein VET24_13960 [Actinomycetota bacterium]|nr:hypothetical protein [Actinomycetota bacterium]
MDAGTVTGTAEPEAFLTAWDPETRAEIIQRVRSGDDVLAAARRLLDRYQQAGILLPGLELRTGNEEQGSLSIAVRPSQWALVHTDEEFTQHCTQGQDGAEGSADVSWDELTPIPVKWFVPEEEAAAAVERWLDDGTLTSALRWSDDCS